MIPGRELPGLRALTLWRPWSDAIIDGAKPVENRTWTPEAGIIGVHLAIHGGRKYDDHLSWPAGWIPPSYCGEGIIGVARLAGVLDLRFGKRRVMPAVVGEPLTVAERATLQALDESPWWAGPVGWFFTEPTRIETVYVKGALGLWPVPAPDANRVRERWIAARAA